MSDRSFSYSQVHAEPLDPDDVDEYPDGTPFQPIRLVFEDQPDKPLWRCLEPAECLLDARRARTLAFELLMVAEHAEQIERTGEGR